METSPVTQSPDLDQLVFRNAIRFQKYDFQIVCVAGNRLRIKARADLAATAYGRTAFGQTAFGRDGYFMLADIYQPQIHKLTVNGRPVAYRHWNDIYAFRLPPGLPRRKLSLEVDYEITSKFSSRLVYAELSGAWYPKNLFPERVMAQFVLDVPTGMVGIANGELAVVQSLGKQSRYWWLTERPQTNLAVTIGRYQSYVRLVQRRTYRIFAPPSLEADSRRLSLWASLIGEYYQEHFGGTAYHGLTLVINDTQLEDTSFGALIFLHPDQKQPLNRKFFKLAHEIAHFWWGSLVVPKTPQDWWLAEGFANYSAYLICELGSTAPVDRTDAAGSPGRKATRMIPDIQSQTILAEWQQQYQQFLLSLRDYQIPEMALAEIGPYDFQRELLYNKGAYVLHMARSLLGDADFFRLLRLFVAEYQMKQAGVRDFTRMGSALFGARLADYFRQWVYSAGAYDLAVQNITFTPQASLTSEQGTGKYQVRFKIVAKGQLYLPDMVDLEICTATQIYHEVLYFKGVNVTIQKTCDGPPCKITVNGRGRVLEADLSDNGWAYTVKNRGSG